jgi:hypothetical protein
MTDKELKNLFIQNEQWITDIAVLETQLSAGSPNSKFNDIALTFYPESPLTTLRLSLRKARLSLKIIQDEIACELQLRKYDSVPIMER